LTGSEESDRLHHERMSGQKEGRKEWVGKGKMAFFSLFVRVFFRLISMATDDTCCCCCGHHELHEDFKKISRRFHEDFTKISRRFHLSDKSVLCSQRILSGEKNKIMNTISTAFIKEKPQVLRLTSDTTCWMSSSETFRSA